MKNSHAENLSESFLNVDQKIITEALEIDDAKKLKQYIKQKPEEAKKPFYIKPVFKKATAIAACLAIVAVTAFALTKKPDNNITSNSSETSSQNKKVIYVTGDTVDDYANFNNGSLYLNQKYISPALQEKMDLYKDYKYDEVIFKVVVEIFTAFEDGNEANRLADADKEVQSLYKQYLAAYEEEQKAEAEYYAFNQANPGNEPEIIEKCKEFTAIINAKEEIRSNSFSKWDDKRREIVIKYVSQVKTERLEFLKQFSENEPVATSYNKWAYYVDLTAEEINILAEKGGYTFKFASGDFLPSDIDL